MANSVRIGAYRAASFVSSALLVWVAARQGWPGAFLAGAAITAALAAGSLVLPDTGRGLAARPALAEPVAALLRRPGIWAVLLFALLFKLDISAMDPMTKPFWVARGLSLDQIAALTTGRLLATLAGAALGGILATRTGIFRALWTWGWCSCSRASATRSRRACRPIQGSSRRRRSSRISPPVSAPRRFWRS